MSLRNLVLAGMLAASSTVAQGEGVELLLRDGTVVIARGLVGDPVTGFDADLGGSRRHLQPGVVFAVAGGAAAVTALPAAHLAGGDVIFGAIAGGDQAGNRLELLSPVWGRVPIPVDRLAAFAAPAMAAPGHLQLPGGVNEALFVRAKVGFDVVAGTLHRFGEPGVFFQPEGQTAPRWYRVEDFAALRLSDPTPRIGAAVATLLTRVGDRLAVAAIRWAKDGLQCELEGGATAALRVQDLASVAFTKDVVFLSDLPPASVDESGFDGEVVHPFRRDHNVLGGPLVTGGRAHSKGLGVHSKSRLSFRVPEGVDRFWTRVGFDDSALGLRLEPHVGVRVRVNDRVAFEQKDLLAGKALGDTGLVAVRAGDTVTLEVEHGRGRDVGDRINWLSPVFLPPAARRP